MNLLNIRHKINIPNFFKQKKKQSCNLQFLSYRIPSNRILITMVSRLALQAR